MALILYGFVEFGIKFFEIIMHLFGHLVDLRPLLIVTIWIIPYFSHISGKLLRRYIHAVSEMVFYGLEVDGLFYDVKIVGTIEFYGVDWEQKGLGILVFFYTL